MKLAYVPLFLLIFISPRALGQNWGGGVDDTDIHFGFTFQYISSEYKISKKSDWRSVYEDDIGQGVQPGELRALYSESTPGFGIGFVVNKRVTSHSDLRFTPVLAFSDKLLRYQYVNADQNQEKKVNGTLVELPLSFKLKSDRRTNFRAYMLGGVKFTADISSRKKTNNSLVTDPAEKFINSKRGYFSYETGVGFDLYFEYFKMSPEIKLSYSAGDVLQHENHRFASPIDKLNLRNLTFSLFFE
ncbi:outer membrane beta-barrel protein [Pedobacter faecalis]|uniref:type IX secretion/gliding motility protein PorT/SprT n=1 Tax=Pedobacter faecalis TaxID=3041495 RepID=UPI00255014D9|nr:outer membrane beta-barrel protein [Pedobacter sp. ELA7]